MSDDFLTPDERLRVQDDLYNAFMEQDIAGMNHALSEGANPDWKPVQGAAHPPLINLLYEAVRDGQTEAVETLINWGADINARSRDGETPFYAACMFSKPEIGRLLVEAGANYRSGTDFNTSPQTLLRNAGEGREALVELIEEYENHRPRINPSTEPETLKERLFRKNGRHFAPLDNPQTWRDFEAVGAALLEQGTPITKDEWFDLNGDGERWIDVAVKYRALDKVLGHLHAQGDHLSVQELVDDEYLLDYITQKGGVRHLFTREQLQPEGITGMKELQAHLPEGAMEQVKNRFTLATWLQMNGREATQSQGAGR